jgi:hypothetical protein
MLLSEFPKHNRSTSGSWLNLKRVPAAPHTHDLSWNKFNVEVRARRGMPRRPVLAVNSPGYSTIV